MASAVTESSIVLRKRFITCSFMKSWMQRRRRVHIEESFCLGRYAQRKWQKYVPVSDSVDKARSQYFTRSTTIDVTFSGDGLLSEVHFRDGTVKNHGSPPLMPSLEILDM